MISAADSISLDHWMNRCQDAFSRYSEPLLRQVMQQLVKPRNQWPAEELIERGVATLTNAAVIDRRLNDLPPTARKILAIIGFSQQPSWRVGQLVATLAVLGHAEGLSPILTLLNEGLVQPELPIGLKALKQFEDWLGPSGINTAKLFAHPAVTARAAGSELGLPELPFKVIETRAVRQSDGLEWLLRTAVAWSRVADDPLRLTLQQTLFKRDLVKFQTDELLASPFAEHLSDLPDAGLFALELAAAAELVDTTAGEMRIRPAPEIWQMKLPEALAAFWRALMSIEQWDMTRGYLPAEEISPFVSVFLPSFLLLRSLPSSAWIQAGPLAEFIFDRHPSWSATLKKNPEAATETMEQMLLAIAYPLRLVEATQEPSGWWFRLGDIGRHILRGEKLPSLENDFPQTLIVQPNGEMVIFRQGLTPDLIGRLTRFATWRTLGAACTMELTAESVYRGLETGLILADIQRLLEQRGSRALPANVLDSLQRWSSKRERITVWASATLLEFTSPEDLDNAFSRGLVSVKLTDRIGIAAGSDELDYRHFRLIGNRDYEAKPQKCLSFAADGVTFTIDTAQSDLILEAELGQLAVPLPASAQGPRQYQFTPESLRQAQQRGFTINELERWALERSGESLSNAAHLLFPGQPAAAVCQRRLVVQFPNENLADGVQQWPATGALVDERLGPTTVAVAEENLEKFAEQLRVVGVVLQH